MVETYNFTYVHVKGKLRILELEEISANIGMDFSNIGYVTGNYNVRRDLDRLRATEENKASLFRT